LESVDLLPFMAQPRVVTQLASSSVVNRASASRQGVDATKT
jgi:hypothetical protein